MPMYKTTKMLRLFLVIYANVHSWKYMVICNHKQEINTSRLRNDNNTAQTKYTHGVDVNS